MRVGARVRGRVASLIQHAMRMRPPPQPRLHHVFRHYLKRHDFREKTLLNKEYVFIFSTTFSKTFLILSRI
jgi:hypothetical protein